MALGETISYSMLLGKAEKFEDLKGHHADKEVVDEIKDARDRIQNDGVKRISDSDTIEESGKALRAALNAGGFSLERSKFLVEQLQWAWNAWSGMTHGLAWPELTPGDRVKDGVYRMPGSWVDDYYTMGLLTVTATKLYGQALTKDGSPSL